jgi:hypothetical protein
VQQDGGYVARSPAEKVNVCAQKTLAAEEALRLALAVAEVEVPEFFLREESFQREIEKNGSGRPVAVRRVVTQITVDEDVTLGG